MIENYDSVDVFIGVDVGKGEHHAVALDRAGKQLFDKALPNEEAKLRDLIGQFKERGRVLFVVDQPATIGALPIAVAQAENVLVGYLPGLAMRRIADLHAGGSVDRPRRLFSFSWFESRYPSFKPLSFLGNQGFFLFEGMLISGEMATLMAMNASSWGSGSGHGSCGPARVAPRAAAPPG